MDFTVFSEYPPFSGFIYTWIDGQDPSQNAEIWATTQKMANTKSGKTMSIPERISPHSLRNSEKFPLLGVNRAICEVGFEPFWVTPNRLLRNWARNQVPDQGRECHFARLLEIHTLLNMEGNSSVNEGNPWNSTGINFIGIWKAMWIQETSPLWTESPKSLVQLA